MLRTFKALILITLFGLTACSATQLAYNKLDWLMYWKVSRFVDLDSQQEQATKQALDEFHAWHRQTQLPLYETYLQQFSKKLDQASFTANSIHAETDHAQELVDQSLNYLLPKALPIMATLSDEQVEDILENIAEEREEYVEEYVELSNEERLDKRREEMTEFLEDWTGRLTEIQEKWVGEWVASLEPFEALSAQQQADWQEQIAAILAERSDQAKLQKSLKQLMFYRTDDWHPELEAILDRNQTRTYRLLAQILNNLTPKQRQHFHERLDKFEQDFRELRSKS